MQLDCALILSAGLGTRMGPIGKHLPKVLWPIFNKSLLELQIDYCIDLGIKKIFINVHYLAEEIKNAVQIIRRPNIQIIILHEDPLLDSGGAIHNLARQPEVNYQGNVLLVNGDQFLFFDNEFLMLAKKKLQSNGVRAVLLGIEVPAGASYNETVTRDDQLVEIKKNTSEKKFITYSGLGIIRLDGLTPVDGASKFFQTVVNFNKEKAYLLTPKHFEYWDFGTAQLYSENIFKLVNTFSSDSEMKNFLIRHGVSDSFFDKYISLQLNSIDLLGNKNFIQNSISLGSLTQEV